MDHGGPAPGSEVGGYRIVAPLGSGGMGTVYRAVDGGGHPVALKVLHPHVGADPAARDRLRREVAALQRLRHPGVAAVLDAEADSTEAFVVTELVDGLTLEQHVHRGGPLAPVEVAELAAGLQDALEAVHQAGVVHRDLKPSNVMLTRDGPVLIDFGIAQSAEDTRVTSAGFVVGTPGYLAPELLADENPSPATDWWGWAAVLAFAATGRAPFGTRPWDAVIARTRAGDVDLAGLADGVAEPLRAALAPEPGRRWAPDDVTAGLEAAAVAVPAAPPTQVIGAPTPTPAPPTSGLPTPGLPTQALPAGHSGGQDRDEGAPGSTRALPRDGSTRVAPGPDDARTTTMPAAGAASTAAMPAAGAASTAAMPAAGAASTAAMPVVEGGPTQVVPRGGRPPSVVPASAWAGDAHEHHADERHADERHADEHHADEHRAHHRDAERGGRGGEGAPWGRSAGAYVGDDVAPGSSGAHAWGPPTGAALDAEPEPWVASPPRRRTGSVLALGIATVAAGTLYPGVTLVVLVVTLLVLRTVGVAGEALDRRRERRGGPARGDVARVVGATPWHGLRAAVGLLPSVVVAASAVVVVGGVLWWALQTDRLVVSLGGSEGNGPRAYAAVLGLATLLAVLLVWFGPLGRLTRAGARRALTAVAPGWSGATVLVAAALAVAGVLVVLLLTGQPTTWGPLPGPPDLR